MNLEPIDTSTTAGKIRVMEMAEQGRNVAARSLRPSKEWQRCSVPAWDWCAAEYAIIAEPVGPDEVWATVIDGDVVMDVYATEKEADAALNRGWEKVKYIRADLAGEVS